MKIVRLLINMFPIRKLKKIYECTRPVLLYAVTIRALTKIFKGILKR